MGLLCLTVEKLRAEYLAEEILSIWRGQDSDLSFRLASHPMFTSVAGLRLAWWDIVEVTTTGIASG